MKPNKRDAAAEAFRAGVVRQRTGDLAAAEASYRQALSLVADHDEAHNMMGLLAHQTGRGQLAIEHLRRAVALRPSVAFYHNNLGGVLHEQGRSADAVRSYRKAVRLQPNRPDFQCNLGCALAAAGDLRNAEDSFRAALRLDPTSVDALNGLGTALLETGRSGDALACFESAMRLRPGDAGSRGNMGAALRALGRFDDAVACFRAVATLRPDSAKAWSDLGNMLKEQEAAAEALSCLEKVVSLAPDSIDSHIDLGSALYRHQRPAEAAAAYLRGLEIAPDSAELMLGLAHAALALGDYETGWRAYEARWRIPEFAAGWHTSHAPTWEGGTDLTGKTILLFSEQGFGDTIQFVRFAPLLAARGATVLLRVHPALVSLLARMSGIAGVFAPGDRLPRHDLQCPLLSLPLALGLRVGSIPAHVPYLETDATKATAWRSRLVALAGLKVGLVWTGDPRLQDLQSSWLNRRRSIGLDQLLIPLADVGRVALVSLQKGPGALGGDAIPGGVTLHDWTDELISFDDTAALVQALDQVITVDTAVAHLAGALAKPVWLLNRFDSCWRWLGHGEASPWYPTLRQFRQTAPGDWAGVMARVRTALLSRLANA
jgi:Flp pilus assembly protein TadD